MEIRLDVVVYIDVASIFSAGTHFLRPKSDDLFLVITLFCIIICLTFYCHKLPFFLICGGAPHRIQPRFCLVQAKMPRKFFSSPWGVRLHPMHLPWLRLWSYVVNHTVVSDPTIWQPGVDHTWCLFCPPPRLLLPSYNIYPEISTLTKVKGTSYAFRCICWAPVLTSRICIGICPRSLS